MKKIYLTLAGMLFVIRLFAQVGVGTSTPDASAQLDVSSSSKGVLIPRMSMELRDDILTPKEGLMIYQTDEKPGFYYFTGLVWKAVSASPVGMAASSLSVQNMPASGSERGAFNNWSVVSGSGLSTDDGVFTVPESGKYFVELTVGYAYAGAATSSTFANPSFSVFNPIDNADVLKGFLPVFDVNVPLNLNLRTVINSGSVSFSGAVNLDANDELSVSYNPDGYAKAINIGGTNGDAAVTWRITKIE